MLEQFQFLKIAFNVYSLIILAIIAIVFFSKERMHNAEDSIYAALIITETATIILGLLFGFLLDAYGTETKQLLLTTVNKIYLFLMFLDIAIMDLYVYVLHRKETSADKIKHNKLFIITCIIIFSITMLLPETIELRNGDYFPTGPAFSFSYLTLIIGFIIIITFMIMDRKNLKNKKYLPVILLLITTIVVDSAMIKYPIATSLINPTNVSVLIIMYFTIENPDVKQIKALTLAVTKAEKANRAKSDFLSSMSHEIRTPLNAIVGLSENNLEYAKDCPKEIEENSKDIISASKILLEIVGNILDINKIEANKMELVIAPYIFKDEISNMCKITQTRIDDKPIIFNLNMEDNIPYEVVGDKSKVKEIINNLLTNAIKYTERGNINLNIRCKNNLEKKITNLIISCQDTGKGIKKEDIDKLFNKFERLDVENNTTIEGTGLGLIITQELINMMNGKIDVVSEEGKGSIFTVIIPQTISKMYPPEEVKQELKEKKISSTKNTNEEIEVLEPIKEKNDINPLKILIVDDNKLNIKVAKKTISDLNADIDECYDGQECIDKINDGNQYNIILMDIMMPEMDGEKTISILKQNPEFKTPIIAVTADAVVGAKEKYLSEGFSDYIAKPFHKEDIIEKIKKLMNTV